MPNAAKNEKYEKLRPLNADAGANHRRRPCCYQPTKCCCVRVEFYCIFAYDHNNSGKIWHSKHLRSLAFAIYIKWGGTFCHKQFYCEYPIPCVTPLGTTLGLVAAVAAVQHKDSSIVIRGYIDRDFWNLRFCTIRKSENKKKSFQFT